VKKKLDAYEKGIEDRLGNYVPIAPAEKQRILDIAAKSRTISIRLNETVLRNIKYRAAEEGLPYQTLISSILFKYCSNRLIDENAIRKAVEALK
jgi:predicted DNA binding CopG/RHH family protein